MFKEENTENKDVQFFVEDDESISTQEDVSDEEDDLQNLEDNEEREDETVVEFQSPAKESSISKRTWKQGENGRKSTLVHLALQETTKG